MAEPAQRDVIVVGAGAAGLAVAGELKRRGVTPLLLERSEAVGSSWRGRYRDLELNNDRWTARLPRSRIPRGAGRWPARDEYISYLERYVEHPVSKSDSVSRYSGSTITKSVGGWRPASSPCRPDM